MDDKCNRCGKEFDYKGYAVRSFKIQKFVHGKESGWRTIKLCPKCYVKLRNFLYSTANSDYDGAPDWTHGGCDTGGF